ncbi:MAG: hypothetical protein PQJ58_05620 [Spirochaetales bacterium]|nr:hypothetical protein [Spirochaetales bacterium]
MEFLLEKQIAELVDSRVRQEDPDQKFWRQPITGFALIHERPFEKLKTWVSDDHLLPDDFLPGAESVITFFLPFSKEVTCSNDDGPEASPAWRDACSHTTGLIDAIRDEITFLLETGGFNCAALPVSQSFDRDSLSSRWSHRHIAYLSGIGTFGRNNLLITESGCSGRLGSLITDAPLSSTPYPAREFCIEKQGENCGVCISRCTQGNLSCYELCQKNAPNLKSEDLMEACGRCIAGLPCTYTAPVLSGSVSS